MTQNDSIQLYLESGNTLTPLQALEMFGTLALHSRIAELRNRGCLIDCEMVTLPNGKRVGKYSMMRFPYG